MIIYEVNLDVDAPVAAEFRAWLDEHVSEMLTLPGFLGATIYARENGAAERAAAWTVHYRLRSRESLETYFEEHAERMRNEGLQRFRGRFEASRRILLPVSEEACT